MRSVLRLTAAGAAAALLAGCSSDTSRLAGGPFGPADNTPTASIGSRSLTPPEAVGGAPAVASASAGSWGASSSSSAGAIQSAPLAPPVASAAPAMRAPVQTAAAQVSSVSSAARSAGGSFGPWTTAGGTAVTVAQGESASVLAARYGVPMEALVKANGLASASQVTPGKSLVIPIYNADARNAAAAQTARNAAKTAVAPAKAASKSVTEPAKAQAGRAADAARKTDQKVMAAVDVSKQRAADAAAAKKEAAKKEPTKKQAASNAKANESVKAKDVAQAAPAEAERQVAAAPAAAPDKPEFRWPARGRIIQGFKSGSNDGIAISVPEGTAVKAAESGTVAYAGNELKGYGNLVLIRHPNGFVSAYAHNGEISVKRGDTVKRGQTIAKSGQTGNVSAPQLHFEIRKGATPVDPTQYLAGL